jgi:hypothetical protein
LHSLYYGLERESRSCHVRRLAARTLPHGAVVRKRDLWWINRYVFSPYHFFIKLSWGLFSLFATVGTVSTTSAASATTTTSPTTCSTVAITFNELVTTAYGTSVKIVGSIAALGSWNTANGVSLSASQYTSANPLWSVAVNMAPGTSFEYKFIQVSSAGVVTWESGSNRAYTVGTAVTGCSQLITTSWQ